MLPILRKIKRAIFGPHRPIFPLTARSIEYSAIISADDDPAAPSDRLLDIALQAVQAARGVTMDHVVERMTHPPYYPDVWPGEHYKLLAGLACAMQPATVIEIGTAAGLSALAMRPFLPPGGRIYTLDIVPWREFPGVVLKEDDFADGAITQIIADVSDPAVMRGHTALFRTADLIFVDGPKDVRFEATLVERLGELRFAKPPIVVFDDIRLWNMLKIWRDLRRPKLDLTSFGHWSGTGLVDWRDP